MFEDYGQGQSISRLMHWRVKLTVTGHTRIQMESCCRNIKLQHLSLLYPYTSTLITCQGRTDLLKFLNADKL